MTLQIRGSAYAGWMTVRNRLICESYNIRLPHEETAVFESTSRNGTPVNRFHLLEGQKAVAVTRAKANPIYSHEKEHDPNYDQFKMNHNWTFNAQAPSTKSDDTLVVTAGKTEQQT
jgi:hypothetical protein